VPLQGVLIKPADYEAGRRRGRGGAVVPVDRAVPRAAAAGKGCVVVHYRGESAAEWITNGVPYRRR